ncbi:hypothetical protein M3Y95_00287200 [Aphelenchoides besseyi]|nr:hypothetical protein M3Y95_00287200 [Aphelenchoides besseyi]
MNVWVKVFLQQLLNLVIFAANCPQNLKFGSGPPATCQKPWDPQNRPPSALESWFTREMFEDLFPKANLGWGPHVCFPYSYESFVIAARYFPRFGTETGINYTGGQNYRRDLAAFFAHAIQETGENDISLYTSKNQTEADDCFYRGGLYNWFEGGPVSSLLAAPSHGSQPTDGGECNQAGRYCQQSPELNYYYPCGNDTTVNGAYKQCYFGRGSIQISYNFNYGMFGNWLHTQNIMVDLLKEPNLVLTKIDPPLAFMASIWFYMTPQPPKPAMHDIVIGNWNAGAQNTAAGFSGPIFGPTSLIINNECNGEDKIVPGGGGENRRIKAFKWFTSYFNVPSGEDRTLSCKYMPEHFVSQQNFLSYQPEWSTTWKENKTCECAPAGYSGMIHYYTPGQYPEEFVKLNDANREFCQRTIYERPDLYNMNSNTSACLKTPL